ENGTIASLTHQVLLNREVAHSFCIALSGAKELWKIGEVQLAFAEALRGGDTLLIDAISFIMEYRDIPAIQEAIAFNITTCSSMLFQINIACGMGLCNHPSIKQSILDRKEDIISQIKENWHDSVFLTSTPYLIHDEDIRDVLTDARQDMIREIIEADHLVDISILMKWVEWLRHDPKIVEAVRSRILNTSANFEHTFMKTLSEIGMFQQYPELMNALEKYDQNTISWVLDSKWT
ncbi:MAG: hypothetical protein ACW99H_12965, partial [Candidatus Thorarchaeota archaeon]